MCVCGVPTMVWQHPSMHRVCRHANVHHLHQVMADCCQCLHSSVQLCSHLPPGVPDGDFATLYADMQRFFALDVASKMKVCTTTNPHNRGWTPLGEETLDPARQTCGDTKEGYYIGRDILSGHPCADLPLHGPNVWPDEASLPGWRQNMERYHLSMERVGRRLVSLLALTLGLQVLPAPSLSSMHICRSRQRLRESLPPSLRLTRPPLIYMYTRTHVHTYTHIAKCTHICAHMRTLCVHTGGLV